VAKGAAKGADRCPARRYNDNVFHGFFLFLKQSGEQDATLLRRLFIIFMHMGLRSFDLAGRVLIIRSFSQGI
jgi:hypothetical protein